MRRFEFTEGSSSKFWEAAVEGASLTVRWGRIGSSGQTQTKPFASEAKARSEHDKLVAEKLSKGYVEAGGAAAPAAAVPAAAPAAPAAGKAASAVAASAAPPAKVKAAAPVEAATAPPAAASAAAVPAADEGGWVAAAKGYQVRLDGSRLRCRNAKGQELSSIPKEVKESELGEQAQALVEWLEEHERECRDTAESWMLRSFAAPLGTVVALYRDAAWQKALQNAVVAPGLPDGGFDADRAGFFRGVDDRGRAGVVNLDGETVWLEAPLLAVPHPILLEDLQDFRGLSTELGLTQGLSQLFRETFARPEKLSAGQSSIGTYAGGKFEELNHALAQCRKLGFRVRGGAAICRVCEGGRLVEARYFLGGEDPSYESETEDLLFVDDRQHTVPLSEVPRVALSEGMRMASLIYAARSIEKEGDDE